MAVIIAAVVAARPATANDDTPARVGPVAGDVLKRPDIIGTQEGLFAQLEDIQTDLPNYYDSVGLPGRWLSRGSDAGLLRQPSTRRARVRSLLAVRHPDLTGPQAWAGAAPAWSPGSGSSTTEPTPSFTPSTPTPSLPIVATGDFNAPAGTGQTVFDRLATGGTFPDTWGSWRQLRGRRRPAEHDRGQGRLHPAVPHRIDDRGRYDRRELRAQRALLTEMIRT